MYLLYVDESGDPGKYIPDQSKNSPHFILSGLIVHEDDWLIYLNRLKDLRKYIKSNFGLLLNEEIHSSELIRINKTISYRKIKKANRIKILQLYAKEIPRIFSNSKIINICLTKTNFPPETDFQQLAWSRILQRFNTFLVKSSNERGIIINDDTDSQLLRKLTRKMRVYNPTPSHYHSAPYNNPITNVIEDPFARVSSNSYFIQTADVIAHTLYRKEFPKGSLKKYNLHNYFMYFKEILLTDASSYDDLGIVRK